MPAALLALLVLPPLWLGCVWGANRWRIRHAPDRGNGAVFWLSSASPLIALFLYATAHGVARGDPAAALLHPKLAGMAVVLSLLASLMTMCAAYRGSGGRTG